MTNDNNRDDLRDGLKIEQGIITTEQAVTLIMDKFEYDREEAEKFLKELAAKNPERCVWLN